MSIGTQLVVDDWTDGGEIFGGKPCFADPFDTFIGFYPDDDAAFDVNFHRAPLRSGSSKGTPTGKAFTSVIFMLLGPFAGIAGRGRAAARNFREVPGRRVRV